MRFIKDWVSFIVCLPINANIFPGVVIRSKKMMIILENHLNLGIVVVNCIRAEVNQLWQDIIAQIPMVNRAWHWYGHWIGDGQISVAFNQEWDQGSHWGETADSGVAMQMPEAQLLNQVGVGWVEVPEMICIEPRPAHPGVQHHWDLCGGGTSFEATLWKWRLHDKCVYANACENMCACSYSEVCRTT